MQYEKKTYHDITCIMWHHEASLTLTYYLVVYLAVLGLQIWPPHVCTSTDLQASEDIWTHLTLIWLISASSLPSVVTWVKIHHPREAVTNCLTSILLLIPVSSACFKIEPKCWQEPALTHTHMMDSCFILGKTERLSQTDLVNNLGGGVQSAVIFIQSAVSR